MRRLILRLEIARNGYFAFLFICNYKKNTKILRQMIQLKDPVDWSRSLATLFIVTGSNEFFFLHSEGQPRDDFYENVPRASLALLSVDERDDVMGIEGEIWACSVMDSVIRDGLIGPLAAEFILADGHYRNIFYCLVNNTPRRSVSCL